jgi:hypothetical protein
MKEGAIQREFCSISAKPAKPAKEDHRFSQKLHRRDDALKRAQLT